jgi:putative redox protein
MAPAERITFVGSRGDHVAARLDHPAGPVSANALFAHCFTCTEDLFAV